MESARKKMRSSRPSGGLGKTRKAVQRLTGASDIEIRTNLPQEEKISNALAVLLDSEMVEGSRLAEYRMALTLIAIAWNVSLLPASEQAGAIQKLFTHSLRRGDALEREAIAHVERLIAKKVELFPDDKRWIVSCEANFRRDCVHVTAAALYLPAAAA